MKFFQPQYWSLVFILPLLALFLIWAWRRRARDLDILLNGLNPSLLSPDVSGIKVAARSAFLLAGLFFAIIALARPQWGTHQELLRRQGLDVMVVLDVSRSMGVMDESLGGLSRLDKAKLEISRLKKRLPGDRLGLVLFDKDAFIHCPLTLDHSAFDMFLDVVRPDLMPAEGQGTLIGHAIETALLGFDTKSQQSRVIVLFSDGETFDDDLGAVLNRAREGNVRIYSVGVGSRKGGLIPIRNRSGAVVDFVKDENGTDALSKLAPAVLEQIASATEGKFYLASSGGQALSSLVEDITGLQKAELEGKLVTRYEDRFQIPLVIALFFFMLEFILSDIRGRIWWRELAK